MIWEKLQKYLEVFINRGEIFMSEIIYRNTFENILTVDYDFPVEDCFYVGDNEAIVADGITRDPIGVGDFSTCSKEKFLNKYPRPSGGELAAKEICNSFSKSSGSLKERLVMANEAVKSLNNKYIKSCDYLENDYYGAVASCVSIKDDVLYYSYICDCGVIVFDKYGNIKFKTQDDKELFSDPYIDKIGIPWDLPEARKIVRSEYRNNLNNIVDGKCVSYGALTGEEDAAPFIREGSISLDKGDIVIVYSDGFTNFLNDKEFINIMLNFEKDKVEKYIEEKAREDYKKYGSEKTLVVYKI